MNLTNGKLTPFVQHLITTKGLVYVDASGSQTQLALNGSGAIPSSSPTKTNGSSGGSSNTGLIVALIVVGLALLGGGGYWLMRRGTAAS